MGLFDFLGIGVPDKPSSDNRAYQRRAINLNEESENLSSRSRGVNPFDSGDVRKAKNQYDHHREQVMEFKRGTAYQDFLEESGNKRFMGRIDSRDEVVSWELGAKVQYPSWIFVLIRLY